MQAEEIAHISLKCLVSRCRQEPLPPLVPHDKHRRPRIVFPPEHNVRLQSLEVESAGICCNGGILESSVAIVVRLRSRRCRELAYVAVRSLRDKGLRVRLERKVW